MAAATLPLVFQALSGLGVFLLWGNMGINGAMEAMLKTAHTGIFPDGSALQTTYTGIPPLDYMLSVLVAFFYPIMTDKTPYLVILDIVAAMLVVNMLVLVESRRASASKWLRSPVQWQYQFNGAGVAVFLPIYSLLHLQHNTRATSSLGRASPPISRTLPASEAQAVPLTALWSLVLPIPLLVPPIMAGASSLQIQNGLAVYFFTPLLFALFFHGVVFAGVGGGGVSVDRTRARTTTTTTTTGWFPQPVRTAYAIVGTASALVHLAIVACALSSTDPGLSVAALYCPDGSTVRRGQPDILRAAGLLFSQWDLIITQVAMLLLAISFREQQQPPQSGGAVSWSWRLTLAGVTAILGPGAALAYALWVHEARLSPSGGEKEK